MDPALPSANWSELLPNKSRGAVNRRGDAECSVGKCVTESVAPCDPLQGCACIVMRQQLLCVVGMAHRLACSTLKDGRMDG